MVRNYAENFVWTVINGSEGLNQWIAPCFHKVNRVCYLLSEITAQLGGRRVPYRSQRSRANADWAQSSNQHASTTIAHKFFCIGFSQS